MANGVGGVGVETNGGSVVRVGWGDKSLSIRGAATIVFFMWLALVASVLYSNWRIEQLFTSVVTRTQAEHRELAMASDRTACGVLMSNAERERFRAEYRPGAWSRWCPWIRE